jgi:hypothetical protein
MNNHGTLFQTEYAVYAHAMGISRNARINKKGLKGQKNARNKHIWVYSSKWEYPNIRSGKRQPEPDKWLVLLQRITDKPNQRRNRRRKAFVLKGRKIMSKENPVS